MVVSSSHELWMFFLSFTSGAVFGVIYDFVKSLKFKQKDHLIYDLLLWGLLTAAAGVIWLGYMNGELRWYMLLGCALSLILYFLTVSRWIFAFFSFLVKKTYCFFNIILKFLLTVLRFLGKIKIYLKRAVKLFKGRIKSYEKN